MVLVALESVVFPVTESVPPMEVLPVVVREPNCAEVPKRLVLEAIDEKRLVVVALVVVEFDASKFTKYEVEDAWRPLWNQTGVLVATAREP